MERIAKFYKVSLNQFIADYIDTFGNNGVVITEVYDNIKLPRRATTGSAGYDFFTPVNIELKPNTLIKIPTGIRCSMDDSYVMLIFPRSSMGIKQQMVISNTVPVIDCDYYNAKNEGHIFIQIENHGNEVLKIKAGKAFVQAVFIPFGIADEGEVTNKRVGGIGSTDE